MTKTTHFLLTFLLVLGFFRGEPFAKPDATDQWARLAQGGVAIFLRHALAPGFGDPPTFKLGDCSTQRNLSDAGRQQARQIGAALAELLGLGPVTPLPTLNSFVETREREKD